MVLDKDIIIIDDNYVGEVKSNYLAAGESMESVINEYVCILKGLVEDNGITGKTAEKLQEFAETTEFLLKGAMEELKGEIGYQMKSFIEEVDKADAEIY